MTDRRSLMLALVCSCALIAPGVAHADPMSDAQKAAQDAGKKAKDAADKAEKAMKDAKDAAKGKDAAMGAGGEAAMWAEMMRLAQPSEHHKMLAAFAGSWNAEVKYWMDPTKKEPSVSKGVMDAKLIHGGRFIMGDYKGSFSMPGPDGKMQDMPFTGTLMWGYNNMEQRYESTWQDSMSTTMMVSYGTPSADGKVVESTAETKMPGPDGKPMNLKQREKVTMVSPDKFVTEMWHSDGVHGEMKVMEITYTRADAGKPAAGKDAPAKK